MKRHGDHRGNGIASQQISQPEAQQRLYAEQRREADEHPNRHPAGQGVRRVFKIKKFLAERLEVGGEFFEHAMQLAVSRPALQINFHRLKCRGPFPIESLFKGSHWQKRAAQAEIHAVAKTKPVAIQGLIFDPQSYRNHGVHGAGG